MSRTFHYAYELMGDQLY